MALFILAAERLVSGVGWLLVCRQFVFLYCFGRGRDGSIYDFAALLTGRGTRGVDFAKLRREFEELMR
jgi:hypothetical protein